METRGWRLAPGVNEHDWPQNNTAGGGGGVLYQYKARADPGFFNRGGGDQIIYDVEGGEPTNEVPA